MRHIKLDQEQIEDILKFNTHNEELKNITKEMLLDTGFTFVKYDHDKIIYKTNLPISLNYNFISLQRLKILGYEDEKIKLKYLTIFGNLFAYMDQNQLKEEHRKTNFIFLLLDSNFKFIYLTIGPMIKPNSLYYKNNLDNVITTVKKFSTLIGSERVEINLNNNTFEESSDDIPF